MELTTIHGLPPLSVTTATRCGHGPGDYGNNTLTPLLSHLRECVSSAMGRPRASNFLNLKFLNFRGTRGRAEDCG
jgi:hypothetical protein